MAEETTTSTPARTVGPVTMASAAGAAAGVVIVYTVEQLTGLDVPVIVEGAVGILCTVAGGYLVPPGAGRRRA